MKKIFKIGLFIGIVLMVLASCKKDEIRAVLHPGAANTLKASNTTLKLDSSQGGNSEAVNFHWDKVDYGVEVAVRYTLQIDSLKDDSLENGINIPLGNQLSKSYSATDLNQIALKLGLLPDSTGELKVRIKVEVPGLNSAPERVKPVYSNTLTLNVTPYSTKPQPKYPVPDNLFIVGDATSGGWANPVPVPAQQFTKIDDHIFGIIIQLTGDKEYLFIPDNGDWGHKYAVPDNTASDIETGAGFIPDEGDNIKSPAKTGLYKIIVDFVKGTYEVTPVDPTSIPDHLFIVGDATPGGWDNPVPSDQEFKKTSAYTFSITLDLMGGKEFLLLPVNGSWDHKYAVPDNTIPSLKEEGTFKKDAGDNIPGPDESGKYRIEVNFLTDQYTITKL